MKKNKGMSLIELVIVIALVGILLGLVVPSLNALLGYEAQKATEKIYASLEGSRTEAMSRMTGGIRIYQHNGNYYTQMNYNGGQAQNFAMLLQQEEQIANRRVRISYEVKGAPDTWLPIDDTGIILLYDRTTGGFRSLQSAWPSVNVVKDPAGNLSTLGVTVNDSGKYCTRIKITGGLRTRIITFNIETGTFQIKGI